MKKDDNWPKWRKSRLNTSKKLSFKKTNKSLSRLYNSKHESEHTSNITQILKMLMRIANQTTTITLNQTALMRVMRGI